MPEIEVIVFANGRRLSCAEADSVEDAPYVARVLLGEALDAGYRKPTASFFVDGKLVRAGLRPDNLLAVTP